MVVDRGGRIARKIPIGVVDKVEDSRSGGCGARLPDEFVFLRKRVGHCRRESAGVAFLTIGRNIFECDAVRSTLLNNFPQAFVETGLPAMQVARDVTRRIVRGERVFLALEAELAVGDPVAVATDRRPEIWVLRPGVACDGIVAMGHVSGFPILVRHFERDQSRAEITDLRDHPLAVGKGVQLGLTAIRELAERFRRWSPAFSGIGLGWFAGNHGNDCHRKGYGSDHAEHSECVLVFPRNWKKFPSAGCGFSRCIYLTQPKPFNHGRADPARSALIKNASAVSPERE